LRIPFSYGETAKVGDLCYERAPMESINFTRGVPANESFPIEEVIDAAGAAFKARGAPMLQYGPSLGFQPLREWLAEWQGGSRAPRQRIAAADRISVPPLAEAG